MTKSPRDTEQVSPQGTRGEEMRLGIAAAAVAGAVAFFELSKGDDIFADFRLPFALLGISMLLYIILTASQYVDKKNAVLSTMADYRMHCYNAGIMLVGLTALGSMFLMVFEWQLIEKIATYIIKPGSLIWLALGSVIYGSIYHYTKRRKRA